MTTLTPQDQNILNLLNLTTISPDRKERVKNAISGMTDSEKIKLLGIISGQLLMQVEYEASKAVDNTLNEMATNPDKKFDKKEFTDAVNKVWQDYIAKKTQLRDNTEADNIRDSLKALQEKLKKISEYANEAQTDLQKHM